MKKYAIVKLTRNSECTIAVEFDSNEFDESNNDDMKKIWSHAEKEGARDIGRLSSEFGFDGLEVECFEQTIEKGHLGNHVIKMPRSKDWRIKRFKEVVLAGWEDPMTKLAPNAKFEVASMDDKDGLRRVMKFVDELGFIMASSSINVPVFLIANWVDNDGDADIEYLDDGEIGTPDAYFTRLHEAMVSTFKVTWSRHETEARFAKAFDWDVRGKVRG